MVEADFIEIEFKRIPTQNMIYTTQVKENKVFFLFNVPSQWIFFITFISVFLHLVPRKQASKQKANPSLIPPPSKQQQQQ